MSPLKSNVIIADEIATLSISIGNKPTNSMRKLNVYLEVGDCGIRNVLLCEYGIFTLNDSYGVIRISGDELIPVSKCATLASCQAVALADFVRCSDLEVVDS